MFRTVLIAAIASFAAAAAAQVAGAPGAPGAPAGLGGSEAPSAVGTGLASPSVGAVPPRGGTGTIGDGRVGTLAPGAATMPAVTGQPGTPTTAGVSGTTQTTNPPPR